MQLFRETFRMNTSPLVMCEEECPDPEALGLIDAASKIGAGGVGWLNAEPASKLAVSKVSVRMAL